MDPNSPNPGLGTSWQTAYHALSDALVQASTNDPEIEDTIFVADGTYLPESIAPCPMTTRIGSNMRLS